MKKTTGKKNSKRVDPSPGEVYMTFDLGMEYIRALQRAMHEHAHLLGIDKCDDDCEFKNVAPVAKERDALVFKKKVLDLFSKYHDGHAGTDDTVIEWIDHIASKHTRKTVDS